MTKRFLTLSFALYFSLNAFAQRTPAPSQSAEIRQTIGITDFTVNYSRPSLKGRQVFADKSPLAPLQQLWRTGANLPSTLEVNTEFTLADRKVPAGKYALLTIPAGDAWAVILNKKFDAGTESYNEAENVAKVMVAPTSGAFNEVFKISVDPLSDSTGYLTLSWSSVHVPVPISVKTESLTMNSLNKIIAEKPENTEALENGAGYLLNKGKDLSIALSWADKAIALKESYYNLYLKAAILGKLGRYNEALPVAQKALTLGKPSDQAFNGFFKGQIEKTIAEIQPKVVARAATTPVKKKKKK